MNLLDLYEEGGFEALKHLAAEVKTHPQYLRQCATGWKGKEPSPRLAAKLIAAEPRLTWEEIYAKHITAKAGATNTGPA